ncbi:ATP-binding protein [Rugamonas rivuli]|uniref:ATP-binding protein n=1 Tax=Rugamonas rivuli TaxID=2743358 RepID=A0A843SQQ9_9BURK|nr:ATP-binding protein [Rugamonas rivuli]MQA23237.1 ATP-binding protein [Rugamonas rivuli]
MFHAYRDGREGSKQRAINFDGDVVDRVFPSAKDSDKILIQCRCLDDETTIVEKAQWLKRQGKNWRFEGNCPKSSFFKFVEPGVLFAMVVDASTSPATATWVVIPKTHPAHEAIVNHGESARLDRSGMIALFGNDGAYSTHVLGEHFHTLFQKTELSMPNSIEQDSMAPDPVGLFEILASAGHRLPSAVADLVDNSISAGASKIEITFPNPNDGGRWMSIRDNGRGMTYDDLRKAMRVGNRRLYDGGDLGKFGYGLKGASWSQSDCLTVVTKAQNGIKSTMTWDKDHLAKTGAWDVLEQSVEEKYEAESEIAATGTVVLLTRMRPPAEMATVKNVDPYTVEVTSVREHLELVFHRYLEGAVPGRSKVDIYINGEPLEGNNPMGHPLTKSYDPRTLMLNESDPEKKAIVAVRAFITPNEDELEKYHCAQGPEAVRRARERISLSGRWNETQGLYFYRLNRLIKWGGWEQMFAVDEKTKLLRVAVDFDRQADDPLKVNISKQEIKLPVNMSSNMKDILKEPRTEARSRYRKTGKGESSGSASSTNGGSSSSPVTGEPIGAPTSSGKPKSAKVVGGAIRLVDSGAAPWVRKKNFTGEHIEVTPQMPALVNLVLAVDGDPKAKIALSQFLLALEQADILKMLTHD